MKKTIRTGLIFLALLQISFAVRSQSQEPPFRNEIQAFKKQDSLHFPPGQAILFVGSSSFRFWTDVSDYFPGYTIINRGFGGSCLPDLIRYADDIIFPYQPRQVVIYCGENDLAASDTVTAEMVFDRFKRLFYLIRKRMPGEPVVFLSLKPSPSRENLMPAMAKANNRIRVFMASQKKAVFVDVYHAMLTPEGKPMPDIFRPDSLHMIPKGYVIWQKLIAPHLIKN